MNNFQPISKINQKKDIEIIFKDMLVHIHSMLYDGCEWKNIKAIIKTDFITNKKYLKFSKPLYSIFDQNKYSVIYLDDKKLKNLVIGN